jgi:hypothetical protein
VSPASVASINASTAGANRYAAADALAAPMDAANASAILTRVATGATRDMAWAWMRANWRTLYAFFGFRSTLATLVRSVTRAFVSLEYATDVASVFEELQAGPFAATVVDGTWQRAVESVRANAAWAASADAAAVCSLVLGAADRTTPPAAAGEAAWAAERLGGRLWSEV